MKTEEKEKKNRTKKNGREKGNGLEQFEKYKEFKTFLFYQLLSEPHVTYFSVVLIYLFEIIK